MLSLAGSFDKDTAQLLKAQCSTARNSHNWWRERCRRDLRFWHFFNALGRSGTLLYWTASRTREVDPLSPTSISLLFQVFSNIPRDSWQDRYIFSLGAKWKGYNRLSLSIYIYVYKQCENPVLRGVKAMSKTQSFLTITLFSTVFLQVFHLFLFFQRFPHSFKWLSTLLYLLPVRICTFAETFRKLSRTSWTLHGPWPLVLAFLNFYICASTMSCPQPPATFHTINVPPPHFPWTCTQKLLVLFLRVR